jgi:hypothetical protein
LSTALPWGLERVRIEDLGDALPAEDLVLKSRLNRGGIVVKIVMEWEIGSVLVERRHTQICRQERYIEAGLIVGVSQRK